MRVKLLYIVIFASVLWISGSGAFAQDGFGLQAGFSSSTYRVDSARDIRGITWLSGGAYYQYRLQDKWQVHMALQYSGRGADTELGDYRGHYIDLQLLPRYDIGGIVFELGFQYAIIMKQSLTRIDKDYLYLNTDSADLNFNENTYPLSLFNNQPEVVVGAHLHLQENFSIGLRYSLPLAHMEYTNFQFSMAFLLIKTNQQSAKKEEEPSPPLH